MSDKKIEFFSAICHQASRRGEDTSVDRKCDKCASRLSKRLSAVQLIVKPFPSQVMDRPTEAAGMLAGEPSPGAKHFLQDDSSSTMNKRSRTDSASNASDGSAADNYDDSPQQTEQSMMLQERVLRLENYVFLQDDSSTSGNKRWRTDAVLVKLQEQERCIQHLEEQNASLKNQLLALRQVSNASAGAQATPAYQDLGQPGGVLPPFDNTHAVHAQPHPLSPSGGEIQILTAQAAASRSQALVSPGAVAHLPGFDLDKPHDVGGPATPSAVTEVQRVVGNIVAFRPCRICGKNVAGPHALCGNEQATSGCRKKVQRKQAWGKHIHKVIDLIELSTESYSMQKFLNLVDVQWLAAGCKKDDESIKKLHNAAKYVLNKRLPTRIAPQFDDEPANSTAVVRLDSVTRDTGSTEFFGEAHLAACNEFSSQVADLLPPFLDIEFELGCLRVTLKASKRSAKDWLSSLCAPRTLRRLVGPNIQFKACLDGEQISAWPSTLTEEHVATLSIEELVVEAAYAGDQQRCLQALCRCNDRDAVMEALELAVEIPQFVVVAACLVWLDDRPAQDGVSVAQLQEWLDMIDPQQSCEAFWVHKCLQRHHHAVARGDRHVTLPHTTMLDCDCANTPHPNEKSPLQPFLAQNFAPLMASPRGEFVNSLQEAASAAADTHAGSEEPRAAAASAAADTQAGSPTQKPPVLLAGGFEGHYQSSKDGLEAARHFFKQFEITQNCAFRASTRLHMDRKNRGGSVAELFFASDAAKQKLCCKFLVQASTGYLKECVGRLPDRCARALVTCHFADKDGQHMPAISVKQKLGALQKDERDDPTQDFDFSRQECTVVFATDYSGCFEMQIDLPPQPWAKPAFCVITVQVRLAPDCLLKCCLASRAVGHTAFANKNEGITCCPLVFSRDDLDLPTGYADKLVLRPGMWDKIPDLAMLDEPSGP